MYKRVLYGSEARKKILEGVNKIVDAAAVTLGANGRNVIIAQSEVVNYGTHSFPLHVTKDGVTTIRAFDIQDEFEKVGVMAVKEASEKTVSQAGDGTTSTSVLLRAIITSGMKKVEEGQNPIQLKNGIDRAVGYVVEEIAKKAIPVSGDLNKIRQIACVSANNDESIGGMIADAFARIGEEGVIDLEASNRTQTEIRIADGFKFEKGYVHPLFANNKEKQVCEFEDPLILLYEKRINHHTQVQAALQIAIQKGQPLLIICEEIEQQGLSFLAMNVAQGRVRVCVTSAPEFGEARRLAMEDIALLTGGTFLSDTKGTSIKSITDQHLGRAKKVVVTKDETVLIGGEGNRQAVENQLNELRMNLTQAKDEEEKEPIEKRIAKLTGGVAVIQVGGATETEMKERLDRFDDAVKAVKSALAEGYVPGGGTAFVNIPKPDAAAVADLTGFDVVLEAITEPLKQICRNSGVDEKNVLAGFASLPSPEWGYNARSGQMENLLDSGIIDPAKVLRCSLQNAASAAGMILTAEAVIVDSVNP